MRIYMDCVVRVVNAGVPGRRQELDGANGKRFEINQLRMTLHWWRVREDV